MLRRYLLITPCRDEAAYIQITIDTIAHQSVLPTKWVIVDDGSTDDTPTIISAAQEKYPYIDVITRKDRGERAVGPGVIDAFYAGLKTVDLADYDYVCKLDGDLDIPAIYFETVMKKFEEDPYLGTFSGRLYAIYDGVLMDERCGGENSVGPAKFFRTECFKNIGGFVRQVCWDGIDGHMSRMNGWLAYSDDDPEIRITHLRRMGSSQKSLWTGRLRWGMGKYFMGSALYYVFAASVYRMFEKPYFIGGLGIFIGYIQALLRNETRIDDKEYLKFFQKYELFSLFQGKNRTMEKYHKTIRETFLPPNERKNIIEN